MGESRVIRFPSFPAAVQNPRHISTARYARDVTLAACAANVATDPNAGALFDLRWAVRESMVARVQRTPHAVVPAQRIKPAASPAAPDVRRDGGGEAQRMTSSLFPDSPEAEERGRAFNDAKHRDDDLARANGQR